MTGKIKIIIIGFMIMVGSVLQVQADNGDYLVKFKDGFMPDVTEYNLTEINRERGIYSTDYVDGLDSVSEYIEYTSQNSEVSLIEGEKGIVTFSLPRDELYADQWQLQLINAEAGWNLETYGNDIKVAVIDSGCIEHEDLKNNLLEGKNYLTGTNDVTDNNGHGTHVTGIIAAEMNDVGIVGVAPKAKIVPLKCFDPSQSTYVQDILDAIYDAVDVYDCKIINMSWGIDGDDPFLKNAINYAYDKGAILVAAVGNYSSTKLCYPAAYENVIGVSSVGKDKNHSSFAQYNKSVFVCAAGERVRSTYKDGGYQLMQGTSQAAPMISGMAAVALSVNGKLTNQQFKQLLMETAEDLGDEGYDVKYGYGLANEIALVNKLLKDTSCYVSPVNTTEEDAYVLIKNTTETVLDALSMFSEYDNGKFKGCMQTHLMLLPDEEIVIRTKNNGNKINHLLWHNLIPITEKR